MEKATINKIMKLTASNPVCIEDVEDFIDGIISFVGAEYDPTLAYHCFKDSQGKHVFSHSMCDMLDDHYDLCNSFCQSINISFVLVAHKILIKNIL